MKIEEAKNMQNVFKLNLNKISKGRFKSEEQKSALKNIKLLYKLQEAVIKLFSNCSPILSQVKHKSVHGEGLQILTYKLMLQRLPKVIAPVKASKPSWNY